MLRLCEEFEDSIEFDYAFLESYQSPKVAVSAEASKIDLFWTSSKGFLGRSILLVPKGCKPQSRAVELKAGGTHYGLYPTYVDRCVVLQEGGIFAQEDCLIAGRLTNTIRNDWSKATFNAFSRLIKQRFSRTGSYYLGAKAKTLFADGYRLTFQSSAPRQSDLYLDEKQQPD